MARVCDPTADNEGKSVELMFFFKKFWWTKKKKLYYKKPYMSSMFRMLLGAIQKNIVFRCFKF